MATDVADEFIRALTELESARDIERMVELFADDCEVSNNESPIFFRGTEGARRFWTDYRDGFKDVCSIFQKELRTGNEARLEWTIEGKTVNGDKIKYQAVSVLETADEKIKRFYTSFVTKTLNGKKLKHKNSNSKRAKRLVTEAGI